VNFALVESIKRVLKAKTILGCDVSKEDNVNLFFFQAVFWNFFQPPYARFDRDDIKFPQEFAVFSPQSSSTYDNKDDFNNEPSTGEMSRAETPNIPL
jgi:hypothetical protein